MTDREPFAIVVRMPGINGIDLYLVSCKGVPCELASGDPLSAHIDAEIINDAVEAAVKKAVEEFRERAAHKAASICGTNPYTRRPCFEKDPDKRFWCPTCKNAEEILSLPTEPEEK